MEDKIRQIKLILMDVDGVLTDGGIILGNAGVELKNFNVQDGAGITLAHRAGLKTGILTERQSEAVRRRAAELKLDVVSQGHQKKLAEYAQIKKRLNLTDAEIAYIGDDVPDLPVLRQVGFSASVANGRPEVQKAVDFVAQACGGHGAVREFIELILKTQGKWEQAVSEILK